MEKTKIELENVFIRTAEKELFYNKITCDLEQAVYNNIKLWWWKRGACFRDQVSVFEGLINNNCMIVYVCRLTFFNFFFLINSNFNQRVNLLID